jgi:hypothetical protein
VVSVQGGGWIRGRGSNASQGLRRKVEMRWPTNILIVLVSFEILNFHIFRIQNLISLFVMKFLTGQGKYHQRAISTKKGLVFDTNMSSSKGGVSSARHQQGSLINDRGQKGGEGTFLLELNIKTKRILTFKKSYS